MAIRITFDPPSVMTRYFDGSGSQWYGFYVIMSMGALHSSDKRVPSELIEMFDLHKVTIPADRRFFRARKHPPAEHNLAPRAGDKPLGCIDMGPPPASLATGGRLNPAGVPYLYLADSAYTAISETRPHVGGRFSVAEFVTLDAIDVFDITASARPSDLLSAVAHLAQCVDEAFARPTHPDSISGYAATQYIAELVKAERGTTVKGICYSSAVAKNGKNLALFGGRTTSGHAFDPMSIVQMIGEPKVFHVDSLTLTTSQK